MSVEMAVLGATDQRETERFPHTGSLEYRYGLSDTGIATWHDVGRDGVCIRLGRYLRPGRSLVLIREERELHDEPRELKGRIVWCRPSGDGETYLVGVKVHRSGVELCYAMSSLVREALKRTIRDLAENRQTW